MSGALGNDTTTKSHAVFDNTAGPLSFQFNGDVNIGGMNNTAGQLVLS